MGFAAQNLCGQGLRPRHPGRSECKDRSHYARRLLRLTPHSLADAARLWRSAKASDRSHCATGLLPFAPHFLVDTAGVWPAAMVMRHGALPLAREARPQGFWR